MWKELFTKVFEESEFHEPITKEDLLLTENKLNSKFPNQLSELLLESNGVDGEYGISVIWDLKRIEDDNLFFRNNADFKELYEPFDNLLFFSDAGNKDLFAFSVVNGICTNDIFMWDHEDDSRTLVSSSLSAWIKGI